MGRSRKSGRKRGARRGRPAGARSKAKKNKTLKKTSALRRHAEPLADPRAQQQLKTYEEAVRYFQQQKFHKAKQAFEKVMGGPSKELGDRATVHLRICGQRMSRLPTAALRGAEDHYHHAIAMMNLGHWDDAREHLLKARKIAPKAEFVYYALAALDCLTGEADSALGNLKMAIELRPENRYHARNDEDFAFLQEDPRFTELLYPEREGAAS